MASQRIRHLEGPLLEAVRAALTNQTARTRGVFRPDFVAKQLETPNERSNLGVNIVWQLGVLELWLQGLSNAA